MDLSRLPTAAHWSRVGMRPHHGICVPLFSLHSKTSCGIGDFYSLIPLIDWCTTIGFDTIQLLPLNDTGDEACPYYALSAFALDPLYIHIPALATEKVFPRSELKSQKIKWLRKRFNPKEAEGEIGAFIDQNPWVQSYASFRDPTDVAFQIFLQCTAFRQMWNVKQYASKKGIFLMGDLPISLSPHSADVCTHPQLFDLRYSAGAPPDYYNRGGQNWGSPIFNWEEVRKEKFLWWRDRLNTAEQFFHLYRIDHIVGYFRIWAIGQGEDSTQGRFIPEDPELWKKQGRELLEMMIQTTGMLPLAEDLGVIPEFVTKTLHDLGVCTTKVMRWQKGLPKNYEPQSVTTVSTPDSEPLQLWWKKFPEEAKEVCGQKGWSYQSELTLQQRREILGDSHRSGSLFHINLLPEYLALFPDLVSSRPEEERINIPGTVLSTNWTYRIKPSVEEMVQHPELAKEMRRVIQ